MSATWDTVLQLGIKVNTKTAIAPPAEGPLNHEVSVHEATLVVSPF